jgi:hypothetical protein
MPDSTHIKQGRRVNIFEIPDAVVMAARQRLAQTSLADFAQLVDIPTVPLTDESEEDRFSVMRLNTLAAHHALTLEKLQGIEDGTIPNLMLLLPPGSAKSTYADVVFVPWFMSRKPRRHVILASYASEIAEKQGRRARQLINSKSFGNLLGRSLRADQKAAHQWTLDNGSEFMAGGILSGLTGNRAALGILDDPIRGREAAESETIRNKTWSAYTDDFCSRLIPGAPQVMILTRWHEDDPAGRILPEGWDGQSGWFDGRDRRRWYVICLPAIADRADDPLGRKIGETLWPEWFNHEHWAPFQANRRTWTSLYQQKPKSAEGTFFKREWFKRYTPKMLPAQLNKYLTTDHAPGGAQSNDFNCARVWGCDPSGDLWMVDGFRKQCLMVDVADLIVGNRRQAAAGRLASGQPVIEGLLRKHQPFAWFPEADNNWKSSAGFMERMMREESVYCRVEPISPHGSDKPTKAQAFQGMAASGRVWIPEGPEGDDVIDQYVGFPGASHDDEVDAASVMGRAINDAHPAIVPMAEAKKQGDSWDRAFNRDEEEEDNWKLS